MQLTRVQHYFFSQMLKSGDAEKGIEINLYDLSIGPFGAWWCGKIIAVDRDDLKVIEGLVGETLHVMEGVIQYVLPYSIAFQRFDNWQWRREVQEGLTLLGRDEWTKLALEGREVQKVYKLLLERKQQASS